jgi:hypothetical protein
VKNTLAQVDGIVTVTFSVNAVQHVVRRKAKADTIQLKIGDGEFEDARPMRSRSCCPFRRTARSSSVP